MSKSYPPELRTPFEPMRRPSLAIDAEEFINKQLTERAEERKSKLMMLLQHYGISADDPDVQLKLLWALIYAHVPGFSVKGSGDKGSGRPRKTTSEKLQLISDVARLRLDNDRSIISVCKELCESPPYNGDKPDSLQRRYDDARRMPFAQILISLGLDETRPDLWADAANAWNDCPEVEEFDMTNNSLPNKTK